MMLAAVALFAEYAGTLDVSNRVEARARHTQDVVPTLSADLVDTPTARLGLRDRRWEHGLGYSAILVAPDVQAGLSPQLLQLGDVSTTWHDRRVRITLAESGTYGEQNSGYLLGGPPVPAVPTFTTPTPGTAPSPSPSPTPTPTPTTAAPNAGLLPPATLRTGSSRTTLSTRIQLSRLWSGSTLLEYSASGGVDAASRATLPFLTGPRGEAATTYTPSRIDALETRLSLQHGRTSAGVCSPIIAHVAAGATCAPTVNTAQVTEQWRRRLTRGSTGTLAGGGSIASVRLGASESVVTRVFPVIRASFEHARELEDLRTVVRVDASLSPAIDVRTGILDERAQAGIALTVPVESVTFTGAFGGTRSVTSPFVTPITGLQGLFEVDYRVDQVVSVGTGFRYMWQEQEGLPRIAGGAAFVQATFRAAQAHF